MENNKVGAVIVAGGLSSRMKDFKPLLKVGNKTMIETIIDNFQSIGIENIIIVTGYRAKDLENVLINYKVKVLRNEDYDSTQMFDSVCIGLNEIVQEVDMTFISPSDSPFVQEFTLKKMIEEMNCNNLKIVQPSYNNINGHPLLLSNNAINEILTHDGYMGLQGAINKLYLGYKNISFADPGIILDADTPCDYFKLIEYYENKSVPTIELCIKIMEFFKVSDDVKEHSFKVAMSAVNICERLKEKGITLNINVIIAASLLHDIAKGYKSHSQVGARWLSEMGFEDISIIVDNHANIESLPRILTEKEVVYLADKMVKGINTVSIEERFSEKKEIYKSNLEILNNIERRKKLTNNLYEAVFNS